MSTPQPFQAPPPVTPLGAPPPGGYVNPNNGQPMSSPGSPGIGGALMDALAAIFKKAAPTSITQIAAREKQREAASGLGNELNP